LGKRTVTTRVALPARDVVMQGHPFTHFEIRDPPSDPGDDPSRLMTKNPGRLDGAVENFLNVGGTNTTCRNSDEQFVRAD
jgi:hypothetical protein